jgi:single-strand DNA-binding protein
MPTTEPALGANLTILVGTLHRAPERRELPSGESVLGLEVSVRPDQGALETVPVAWYDAPTAAELWAPGEQVLVSGRTRRRFFRVGGTTQSRTEVVAAVAVLTRRARAARSALEAASREVLGALDP